VARYIGPKEKIERRLGAKLFLKGERSYSPKSATVKRMYPPGMHGKKFRPRLSEYGSQLQSKQKIRNTYRLLERQFKNWAKEAMKSKIETGDYLVRKLERRLDNAVFRSGFAQSRDQARQLVTHGHILMNGRKVTIPSCQVKTGDEIKIKEGSLKTRYFSALLPQWIKKYEPPSWIEFDSDKLAAKIKGLPTIQESGLEIKDIQALIEFYSR
jgi:small subunit ribosomal protein S4